jgi:hypothetical protein
MKLSILPFYKLYKQPPRPQWEILKTTAYKFVFIRFLDIAITIFTIRLRGVEANPFNKILLDMESGIIVFIIVQSILTQVIVSLMEKSSLVEKTMRIFIPINALIVLSNIAGLVLAH